MQISEITKNPTLCSKIQYLQEELAFFYSGSMEKINNLMLDTQNLMEISINEKIYEQKFFVQFLKVITKAIKNGDILHSNFELNNIDEKWVLLKKQLLILRIEELKTCKVVQKGRKYDISELKLSYLGKEIAKNLSFARKYILTKPEYDKIVFQIRRLKYEVPVIIKPTTTEKFFK